MTPLKTFCFRILCTVAMTLCLVAAAAPCEASNSTNSTLLMQARMLYHGVLEGQNAAIPDGDHQFHVRIFGKDGGLVHDETINAEVRAGSYDLLLGSTSSLAAQLTEEYNIHISIDDQNSIETQGKLSSYMMISDAGLGHSIDEKENHLFVPISTEAISAQMAEHIAIERGVLLPTFYSPMNRFPVIPQGLTGLVLEIALAPPASNTPTDAYQLAKYGRVSVEYNNIACIYGNPVGVAAQALHVAHHLLFYSAGLTSDINNDGMFMMTTGLAHYQSGNNRFEPFVDAPFMRFKFRSSPEDVFVYSEVETTMHERQYISGTVGLGFRLTPSVQMIGGFHHTEFVMLTERTTQQVNGIQGIIAWGF